MFLSRLFSASPSPVALPSTSPSLAASEVPASRRLPVSPRPVRAHSDASRALPKAPASNIHRGHHTPRERPGVSPVQGAVVSEWMSFDATATRAQEKAADALRQLIATNSSDVAAFASALRAAPYMTLDVLEHAVINGDEKLGVIVLSRGAVTPDALKQVMELAAELDQQDMISLLCRHGYRVDEPHRDDSTLLELLVWRPIHRPEVTLRSIKTLVDEGALNGLSTAQHKAVQLLILRRSWPHERHALRLLADGMSRIDARTAQRRARAAASLANAYQGKHGFSVIKFPDGRVYEGEALKNLPHGFGRTTLFGGGVYEGEHCAGFFHGFGVGYAPDKSRQSGRHFFNFLKGSCRYEWEDGRFVECTFKDNVLLGKYKWKRQGGKHARIEEGTFSSKAPNPSSLDPMFQREVTVA